MRTRLYHLAFLLSAVAAPLFAHDMWLEPSKYGVAPGERVILRLYVGEAFRAEEMMPASMERVSRLESHGSHGLRKETSLSIDTAEEGRRVVVMERVPASIELDAEKFNSYLEEEGHQEVARERMRRGEYGKPGRERYTRHLKTIIQSGAGREAVDHVFGTRLEIVPLTIDRTFTARVLFEGKPLAGARLGMVIRGADGKLTRERFTRTDADGRARITLDGNGAVFIRTTHIRRCAGCPDADYESFWSALTFQFDQSGTNPSP